ARGHGRDRGPRPRAGRRAAPLLHRRPRPPARGPGDLPRAAGAGDSRAGALPRRLRAARAPAGGDPARRRPRPSVPAPREPGGVPLRPTAAPPLPGAKLSLPHVPPNQVAPRFVALPAPPDQYAFMLLEDLLRLYLPRLYEGYEIVSSHAIRVTRDAEVEIPRGRAQDLLAAIEEGLRER